MKHILIVYNINITLKCELNHIFSVYGIKPIKVALNKINRNLNIGHFYEELTGKIVYIIECSFLKDDIIDPNALKYWIDYSNLVIKKYFDNITITTYEK